MLATIGAFVLGQPCYVRTIAGRQMAFARDGTPTIDAVFFDASGSSLAPNNHFVVDDNLNRLDSVFRLTSAAGPLRVAGINVVDYNGDA